MIDLHGHYLPGVDDGAPDMEASLAMLRLAQADGIEAVVVTPHACSSLCSVRGYDELHARWERFRQDVGRSGLELKTYGGAEVFLTSELLSILGEHRDLLVINSGSYVLIEFPADYVYAHSKKFVFKLLSAGYIPIVSHPERNREIQRSPAILRELVEAGVLCQLNAGSLRGDFGSSARESAFSLVRANLVHVIASDAHDLESRRPGLSHVPELLRGVDPAKVRMYIHDIPQAIVADQAVPDIGEPEDDRPRRSFFAAFRRRES